MAGFSTYAAIRTALDARQYAQAHIIKPMTAPASSAVRNVLFMSLWSYASLPAAGGNPGAPGVGTIYVNDPSSLCFPDRPGTKKYLSKIAMYGSGNQSATCAITRWFHDRLVGVNLTGLAAGTTAVNTPALPRYADGRGVTAWLESISQAGGTNSFAITYTNELGVPGRVSAGTFSLGNTSIVGAMIRFMLAPGDLGIRSVQSVTVTGAGTGNHNIVLVRPLVGHGGIYLGDSDCSPTCVLDLIRRRKFIEIHDGASLMFAYWLDNGSQDHDHRGYVEMVYA